jgi:hypothetical protein
LFKEGRSTMVVAGEDAGVRVGEDAARVGEVGARDGLDARDRLE